MTEQEVDGETFFELSPTTDLEGLLQCNFTLGAKTKLKKLMATVCKHPSGMVYLLMDDTQRLLSFSLSCSHPTTKRTDSYSFVLGPTSSLEKPCFRIEHQNRGL